MDTRRYFSILIILLALVATGWVISNSQAALAAPAAPQATCNWVGGSGNWSEVAHWDCGAVPGAGDSAIIDGYPTVTLDISVTVSSLSLDDGYIYGDHDLTVTEAFTMTGWNALLTGSGMLNIPTGATFTLTGMSAGQGGLQRSIDNYGTIVIGGDPSNRLDIGGGVTINNYAGAVLEIQSNRPWVWYGGTGTTRPVIQNEGTLRKTTAGEAGLGDLQVNNAGLIDLTGGGIFVNLYTQSGEARANDAAAYLRLGSTVSIDPGATFTGSGWIIVSNGTTTLNTNVSILNLQVDGTLTGDGDLTITGLLKMDGFESLISGNGLATLVDGAEMSFTGCSAGHGGLYRSIENYGTITIGGAADARIDVANGVVISNTVDAVINITSDRIWLWYGGGSTTMPILHNEGTIHKTSTGTASILGVRLVNNGLVTIRGGLRLSDADLNAILEFDDVNAYLEAIYPGVYVNAGASFNGPGWVIVSGTLTINADASMLNLQINDGKLTGDADLTITGLLKMDSFASHMDGNGKTILAPTASMSFTGCSAGHGGLYRSIENYGTITIGGDPGNRIDIANGVVISNTVDAVMHITSNRPWVWYGGGSDTRPVIRNEGLLDKANIGQANFYDVQIDNSGTISLTNASLGLTHSNHSGLVLLNSADAALNFVGGENQVQDGADFRGPGWVSLSGLPIVAFSGASSAENLWQDGGTLRLGDPTTATLTITGEFKRTNGDFQSLNSSTLAFEGDEVLLNLAVDTTFENLAVLTDTLLIEVTPTDYASYSGRLTNLGVIRKTQNVAGTGSLGFGLTGAAMNIQTQGSLTMIQVDRRDSNHPDASILTATGLYWSITPTGADYTLDLTLSHTFSRPETVNVCRYTGTAWDCSVDAHTEMTVTRNGITALSDWALGHIEVYIPIIIKR